MKREMKNNLTNRRNFLKGTFTIALSLGFTKNVNDMFTKNHESPMLINEKKEAIPGRRLGKTGQMVPMLCVGGYHIGRMQDERYAIRMIHAALDAGANFFDSAWSYNDGESERRLGKALKDRRDKAFIMTKSRGRDKTTASRELHESLQRLQTDHLDLWQFHDLQSWEEAETIFHEGGAIDAAIQARKEGKIRHIGFTGHRDPEVHWQVIQKYHSLIETVQIPVNPIDPHYLSFVRQVIPEAVKHNIGILGMKTTANGVLLEDNIATIKECLSFAWSQPISSLVSGMDSIEQLKENISLAWQFEKYSEKDQARLLARTAPFGGVKRESYKHPSVSWRIYPIHPLH